MLTELSLNVLDIAQNSTRAGATLVEIIIDISTSDDIISIEISDNGSGMSDENLKNVEDPFFTSRTTRDVGLGIPFFKTSAEITGGSFSIHSALDRGTKVLATFQMSHIDCMPLGDISSTIHNLIVYHADIDFIYRYTYNQNSFVLDTRQFKEVLGNLPLNSPEISKYIMEYLVQNKKEVDNEEVY